jgi:hypothetical protein
MHFSVYDFAEEAFPTVGADGDEISPWLGVIVPL